MNAPDPTSFHDLTDEQIDVRPLQAVASTLAATGIEFRGLERVDSIPMLQWKGAGRKRAPPPSDRDS